ncbi:MAG: hypothetical protein ABI877_11705 [Gemmatimonadaceae bacterium]
MIEFHFADAVEQRGSKRDQQFEARSRDTVKAAEALADDHFSLTDDVDGSDDE